MKPEKKKEAEKTPDLSPEEMEEGDIGGTSSETGEDQEVDKEKHDESEGEEGGGGGYGRPRTDNEDERPPA